MSEPDSERRPRPLCFCLWVGLLNEEVAFRVRMARRQLDLCLSFIHSLRQYLTLTCSTLWIFIRHWKYLHCPSPSTGGRFLLKIKCVCKVKQKESQEGTFSAVLCQLVSLLLVSFC